MPFSSWREIPTIRTKIDRVSVGEVINGNIGKWQELLDRFVWVFPEWVGLVVRELLGVGLGIFGWFGTVDVPSLLQYLLVLSCQCCWRRE
ncbi:MAG: hypothetical protein CM1200mP41_30300 [Gammaproteobacteria bacterium]|nr:MAG: hypothetical protein CM1200mP41_30300 [Gammaproteobacteria bacterium]